jgi:endonuclease-3 related protein
MQSRSAKSAIKKFYEILSSAWGMQHWWPADSQFEVIVGSILTQNTAWTNVARAIDNLRRAHCLGIPAIRRIRLEDLEQLVRPAGYFRQKAQRLKTFVAFLDANYAGNLPCMFSQATEKLRQQLLDLNGVGPETADSILLYAGNHPVFVVDAYARRIFERHGIVNANAEYDDIRRLVEAALADSSKAAKREDGNHASSGVPGNSGVAHLPSKMSRTPRSPLVQSFNQMHALIVGVGKNHCFKSAPQCDGCPLEPWPRGKRKADSMLRVGTWTGWDENGERERN